MLVLLFVGFTIAFRPNPAFGLHNFDDVIVTWCGSRNNNNENRFRASGICQLRSNVNNYAQTLLETDGFSFIVGDTKYSDPVQFEGANTIEYPGEYSHRLETYNDVEIPTVKLTKRYIVIPTKPFTLEKYEITNEGDSDIEVNVMDYITSTQTEQPVKGGIIEGTFSQYFDYSEDALLTNISLIMGMVGANTQTFSDLNGSSPITEFAEGGKFVQVKEAQATQIMSAFQKNVTVKSNSTESVIVYRIVVPSKEIATTGAELVKEIEAKSYDEWKDNLKVFMDLHTANYRVPKFENLDEEKMWYSSVLTMLYSQNPTVGTLVASFHPLYYYKTWTRDAAYSAAILTAMGEYNGAEKFLKWLAKAELRDGGFFATTYSWWDGTYVGFVEPQYDSVGVALYVYYYYTQMTQTTGLIKDETVKQRIRKLEDFLLYRDWKNLIKPDYSIWEESSDGWTSLSVPLQYYGFTQIQGHHGLLAAAMIEEKYYKDTKRAELLRKRAQDLSTSFEKLFWNEEKGYFVQAIWQDNKKQKVIVDTSTATMAFSDIVTDQIKIKKHFDNIRKFNTKLEYGLARYPQDSYFYSSKWNIGGKEAGEASPPWGVVTMFMSWAELLYDEFDNHANVVKERLNWMIKHTGNDYMPCGEAVDGITGDPIMSSMPDVYEHAGVYIMTALQNQQLVPLFNYKKW
ncbi:hypothetical protein EIN_226690 [Entamoeba invadens IP1]|uniref:GH15-like domain-containing protein n=1 Tax=Entamoeba invadens IP1 TaxID=370355 RepID=A0A0A1U2I0_ENTIV|nr:hypothetical protein EIN_226690 [Entamoeba invadens IP1]ELP88286.1 hypothetical protein EIN_226690 [Entamoeba invadens IP1]|eukprot:XP_004255057.1 hypothetical protein EIN_226690 [Entamoeba invadens IP1]